MIWTIIKADLLWMAMLLPIQFGIQIFTLKRARRAAEATASRAWLRGEQTPEQKFKLAQMRARRWKK